MAGTIRTLLHAPGGKRSRFLPACLLGAMVSQAFPVRLALAEDDASATETAAARGLAIDGLKLADGGHCNEAIDKLTRAEKLHHAPIVLSRLGECLITQGKLVDGTEMLRKVLREPLPASPSPALQKARERAQTTLDATKSKIGNLAITIQGPSEGNTSVTVDGQLVPAILLDGDRPTDPGEHVVEATAPGYLKASTKTRVGPGEKQSVTLKLEPDPAAAAIAAAAATPVPVATQPRAPSPPPAVPDAAPSTKVSPPDRTAAYISLAVGGSRAGGRWRIRRARPEEQERSHEALHWNGVRAELAVYARLSQFGCHDLDRSGGRRGGRTRTGDHPVRHGRVQHDRVDQVVDPRFDATTSLHRSRSGGLRSRLLVEMRASGPCV